MTVLMDLFIISFSFTEPRNTCIGNVTDSRHICVTERCVDTVLTRPLHLPPSYFRPRHYSQSDDTDVSTSGTVARHPPPTACNAQAVKIFFKKDSKTNSKKLTMSHLNQCPVSNPRMYYMLAPNYTWAIW